MSASARSAVISLTTKTACSFSSAKERRSPVSSRRRTQRSAGRWCGRSPRGARRPASATRDLERLALAAELVGGGFELVGAFRASQLSEGEERGLVGRRADTLGQAAEDLRLRRPPIPRRWSAGRRRRAAPRCGRARRGAPRSRAAPSSSRSSRRGAQEEREGDDGGERRAGGDRHQTTSPSGGAERRRRRARKATAPRRASRAPSAEAERQRGRAPRPPLRTGDPFRAGLRHPPRRIRAARPDESSRTYPLRRKRKRQWSG